MTSVMMRFNHDMMTLSIGYTDIPVEAEHHATKPVKVKAHMKTMRAEPTYGKMFNGADSTCTLEGRKHIRCFDCEFKDCLLKGD